MADTTDLIGAFRAVLSGSNEDPFDDMVAMMNIAHDGESLRLVRKEDSVSFGGGYARFSTDSSGNAVLDFFNMSSQDGEAYAASLAEIAKALGLKLTDAGRSGLSKHTYVIEGFVDGVKRMLADKPSQGASSSSDIKPERGPHTASVLNRQPDGSKIAVGSGPSGFFGC